VNAIILRQHCLFAPGQKPTGATKKNYEKIIAEYDWLLKCLLCQRVIARGPLEKKRGE